MKDRFPGFKKCLAMMRKRAPQTQEDGFQLLLPHAAEYLQELIDLFRGEDRHGLRCWLLELIGSAKAAAAFPILAEQLESEDEAFRHWAEWGLKELNTAEARKLLWEKNRSRSEKSSR